MVDPDRTPAPAAAQLALAAAQLALAAPPDPAVARVAYLGEAEGWQWTTSNSRT